MHMDIDKQGFAIMTLAAMSACQASTPPQIAVPGARAVSYDDIRNGSGILGYAESLLGPDLATRYQVSVGKGATAVDPGAVVGAWELPSGTSTDTVAASLKATGQLDRVRDRENGQIWIADHRSPGQLPVRWLFIDGSNPAFEEKADPAVRPGPHVYLIAYRVG